MLRFDFIPARDGVPLLCDVLELESRAPELPGPYVTSFVELTFVERGRGTHREVGARPARLDVVPGMVVVGRPDRVKEWTGLEHIHGVTLLLERGFFEQFLKDPLYVHGLPFLRPDAPRALALAPSLHARLADLVRAIAIARAAWSERARVLSEARAHLVTAELAGVWPAAPPLPALVRRFLALHEREHLRLHRVDEYATSLGVSRAQLVRGCRGALGAAPSDLLKARLVAEIKTRLLASQRPLAQIAEEVGFPDERELSRFFKRRTGVTPGSVRRAR